MDNILLPSLVAGIVFVVFFMLLMRFTSASESERKKALLGQMMKENQDAMERQNSDQDLKLLKDMHSGDSFIYKLPGVKNYCDLLVKAGFWEQRFSFWIASAFLFCVLSFALSKLGLFAFLIAGVAAYFLPTKYLKHRIDKRNLKLLDLFPDAIDLIVRSVRSGHPINTAMRMIAENMESPIRDEFKQVTDEVAYGRTLTEALRRMSARLGLADVDFFVVVLAVQQETGGSLTEVLTNLSGIIRKRKQLRAKVRALTSEGRATSYILGAIPVVEFGALYWITPSYLDPLFSTLTGNIIMGIAGALIIASQYVIRIMINIEI